MKKILISMLVLFSLNISFGRDDFDDIVKKQMGNLIGLEVQGMDKGLEDNNFFHTDEALSPFNFSGFEIEFVPSLGIQVPFLAGLEIFVIMELVWAKVE